MRMTEMHTRLPLSDYPLFQTTDLDDAREQVGRIFCPHRLELARGERTLDAVHNSARLDSVGLNFLRYGSAVRITPGELGTFFLVQIPLRGTAAISAGSQSVVSTPARASVLSATEPIDMRWSGDNPQLIVRLERVALERRLEALLGTPLDRPLRFALGMDLALPRVRSWLAVVALLRDEFERGDGVILHSLSAARFEELLMTGLLLAHASNYSGRLDSAVRAPPPHCVRRALDHIHARANEPLTVADIAGALGVSTRYLQSGFRRYLETTPTAYLRDLRLGRVHDELVAGGPATHSVTEVALRWGFSHLGRFAGVYRARYGESPSATLRS